MLYQYIHISLNAINDAPDIRDGPPGPRGTLPAGKGGFPAPPRKNYQNCGEVAGQNKGANLNFLQ